jgi:hypothetical protein
MKMKLAGVGVALLVAAACSSSDDGGGSADASATGGNGGSTAGSAGSIGCDANADVGCGNPTGGSGGAGGSGGSTLTCSGAGKLDCPDISEAYDTCEQIAYKCGPEPYTSWTTSATCDALDQTTGEPMCCVSWEDACAKQEQDCQAAGGLTDCQRCALDDGAPFDSASCKNQEGAACTTNNECCLRCCLNGQCTG